ncbi:MAG: AAA family ATPase [Bacteroidetes bacterium]|nr:AAA family ATPase [Bacteroidota bacterium]
MKAIAVRFKNWNSSRTPTEVRLSGKDLFYGPNGSGKSRVLDAFRFAITGKVGKVNEKQLWDLATQDPAINEFFVEVEFDNGFKVRRTFSRSYGRDRKPKISQEIDVYPKQGERTNVERENRIQAEIGGNLIGFDFSLFDSLSDSKQREYLLQYFPVECTRETMWNALVETLNADGSIGAVNPFMEEIQKDFLLNFPDNTGRSPLDLVSFTADAIRAKANEFALEAEKATHAAEKISEISHEKDQIATQLKTLREVKRSIEQVIQSAKEDKAVMESNAKRRLEIEQEISRLSGSLDDQTELPEDIDGQFSDVTIVRQERANALNELRAKTDAIRSEMDHLTSNIRLAERIRSLTDRIDIHKKAISDIQAGTQPIPDIPAIEAQIAEEAQAKGICKNQLLVLSDRIAVIREYTDAIESALSHDEHGQCPLCKSSVSVEVFRAMKDSYSEELETCNKEMAAANGVLSGIESRSRKLEIDLDRARRIRVENQRREKDIASIQDQIKPLETELSGIDQQKVNESVIRFGQLEAEINDLLPTQRQTEESYNEADQEYTRLANLIKTASVKAEAAVRISELQKQLAAIPQIDGLVDLNAKISDNESKLAQINRDIDERIRQEQNKELEMRTLQQSNVSIDKSRAYKIVSQAIGPKGFQGDLLKNVIRPFIDRVNGYLNNAGLSEYAFTIEMTDSRENEVFRPAIVKNGEIVTLQTINTAHRLMLIFCFIDALNISGYSAIIMDNLEVIDERNEQVLVSLVESLKASNILIAGSRGKWRSDHIRVHQLGDLSATDYLNKLTA